MGLMLISYHITESMNLLQTSIITLILIILVFRMVVPIVKRDYVVLDFLIILTLSLFFFNIFKIFEDELPVKRWLDSNGLLEYRSSVYAGLSFIAALLVSSLERYLLEEKGISRSLLFLGITAFGTIIVALYNFLGEGAFKGTIYHEIAIKIKSTPESLTALLAALGALIMTVFKEFNKEKKHEN